MSRLLPACLCGGNFRSRRKAETGSMTGGWVLSFPAAGLGREARAHLKLYSGFFIAVSRESMQAFQLFRIKPERLKLPAPLSRRIAQSLDTDAAGQAAFYGCFDKIGREEG
jgi:hypothetical protein